MENRQDVRTLLQFFFFFLASKKAFINNANLAGNTGSTLNMQKYCLFTQTLGRNILLKLFASIFGVVNGKST